MATEVSSHVLASFSQDPDRASAGRDPEKECLRLWGGVPHPVLLQGRAAFEKTGTDSQPGRPPQHSRVGRLQHCRELLHWLFHSWFRRRLVTKDKGGG